ncbi:MAG: cytochrome c oxidase subunit II [Solirubrobacteraceae bacterium]
MSSNDRLKLPPELRRIFWIWLILSVIAVPLVVIFVGPALPPGSASDAAHGQQQDNTVMLAIVVPIMIGLLLYFISSLIRFASTDEIDALADGPAIKGDARVMVIWIAATFVIVLFLAAWGAYELFPGEAGAGGGLGSNPISVALPANASSALPVQVIGQQWTWTYRYPTYGGVETTELVLPVGQEVRFSVTSIDVVHSFWAINLAVKADAVPGTANVAFVKPVREESSTIRCAELCGLWHGHMTSRLRVVSPAAFRAWIAYQRIKWAPIQRYLPSYKPTYAPEPSYRAE